jgi:nuclear GTP-binding protein
VQSWTDAEDFLTQVARLSGRLLRGGDPDLNTAARMVLYDWQRGRIPFFSLPPDYVPELAVAAAQQGADGAAGPVVAGREGATAALPEPAGAVSEADAAGEAGARPEGAAAAARAARELLTSAAALQVPAGSRTCTVGVPASRLPSLPDAWLAALSAWTLMAQGA